MRVNENVISNTGTAKVGRAVGDTPERVRFGGGRGESPDQVSLSGLSAEVAALRPDSAVRQMRVAELEQLYAQGQYRTDARRISTSLVDYELA